MCGIFGVVGKKGNAADTILEGLRRLEYRGYDSWGIAVVADGKISLAKNVGKISDASFTLPQSTIGIGHTRWATHGAVTKNNAHPHYGMSKQFVLAHNGIVENFAPIKSKLISQGEHFKTDTDTEVIVKLVENNIKKKKPLVDAVRRAFKELRGRNTIIVLTKKNQIIGARNGSPLVVGRGKNGTDIYFSSDTFSFAPLVSEVCMLENGQIALYDQYDLSIYEIETGKRSRPHFEKISFVDNKVDRQGYDHFMIKEINQSPDAIGTIIKTDEKELKKLTTAIGRAKHIYTIGSGTSGAAASQIAYYLRYYARVYATALIGAETSDYFNLFSKGDLIIAPSQSGETADVLEILEKVRKKGVKIASLVNMPGSMMTRISDYAFMAHAGPEICVMTTKVFVSQLSWGYLVAKTVAGEYKQGIDNLISLSRHIKKYLNSSPDSLHLKKLAGKLAKKKDIFLMGKAQNLAIISEGMIKIIEGSYLHAHAIPAGDLKHYAITLIQEGVPVIVAVSNDSVSSDVLNAISEIKARGAEIIGISPVKYEQFDSFLKVPDTGQTSAIINIIPLQLLAYYMAVALKNNVDKPRNIAKSVTVK